MIRATIRHRSWSDADDQSVEVMDTRDTSERLALTYRGRVTHHMAGVVHVQESAGAFRKVTIHADVVEECL